MSPHETERSFDVGSGDAVVRLPDLTDVPGVDAVEELAPVDLTATYVDTTHLDLLRRGVTLRRRQGGDDEGWHLKLPVRGDTREEVHLPLGEEDEPVPGKLVDLALSLTLGQPLAPVATLHTRRSRTVLRRGSTTVAEVADDLVTAGVTAPDGLLEVSTWREWEVELRDGGSELLDDVEDLFAEVGVLASTHPTKLARALGDDAPEPTRSPRRPKSGKPAGRVLQHYLHSQVDALLVADRAVRRGEEDGVHDLRVAMRRLRTALATWRPLVDRRVTDPLRDRLREFGHRLGDLRDREVVYARLAALLDAEPADLALGEARRSIGAEATTSAAEDRRGAQELLRSPDYLAMIGSLAALAQDPPWRVRADVAAAGVVKARLRQDVRRVRARASALDGVEGPAERVRRLHDLRKAAKRLRYAAEAAAPVAGRRGDRLRRRVKRLQSTLGDHHDTVMTREVLVRLAGQGDLHPGTAFTLGRLHAHEEHEATRLDRAAADRWHTLLR